MAAILYFSIHEGCQQKRLTKWDFSNFPFRAYVCIKVQVKVHKTSTFCNCNGETYNW